MKMSTTEFTSKGSSTEVNDFIAALHNRLDFIERLDENSTLKITGKTPSDRGRAVVDLLILKTFHKVPGLEKFLPNTCQVNGKSFLKHYIGLLGGAGGIASMGSTLELINAFIRKRVLSYPDHPSRMAAEYRIPFQVVVSDLTRKKKKTTVVNKKQVQQEVSMNFARISGSPFILNKEEDDFFKGLETAWDNMEKLADDNKGGVEISSLSTVREAYSKEYKSKQEFVEAYSSWKARRLSAFRTLASEVLTKKELETWRLSNNSKQEALDQLPRVLKRCAEDKDFEPAKKILAGLHPRFIKDYNLTNNPWNLVTVESVRKAFGLLKYYDGTEVADLKLVFKLMNNLTSEMSVLATVVPNPTRRKDRNRHSAKESKSSDEDSNPGMEE